MGGIGGREQGQLQVASAGTWRRYSLPAALVTLALIFALNAYSWVRFFVAPAEQGGQAGDPVALFTQTDYPAITIATRIVTSGRGDQLYDLEAQRQEQNRLAAEGSLSLAPSLLGELHYPYPYTPYIAVLWSPTVGLSPLTGMALWDLLNIVAMAGGLWLLLWSLPLPRTAKLLVLLGGLTSFPFVVNLEQGQSSGLTMLGLAGGIALLRRERDLPAGLALGLLVIKVQWLPLLGLVLLWKRRWWALLGMAATALALTAIVTTAIGTSWLSSYIDVIGRAQRFSREFLLDPAFSHSFSGALDALLGPGHDDFIRLLNTAATVVAAIGLLYLWRGPWRPGTPQWDALMAATTLAAIFTDLQLNTHDLCLLALPAALGLSYLHGARPGGRAALWWCGLLWAAYLLTALVPPGSMLTTPVIRLSAWLVGAMLFTAVAWTQRGRATATSTA